MIPHGGAENRLPSRTGYGTAGQGDDRGGFPDAAQGGCPIGRRYVWRESSYGLDKSDCVEVAIAESVGVRDTKDRSSGQLTVSREAWLVTLTRLRAAR
ncbi:DUF397 domain-containing protein [Amycolatopsis sp. NPDC059021]|uniref:DUF397 domain-containing protein n=1 Tax=Amycolatopsis sp. NPDC059021 TaxID=3346704 RepID=UPI00366E5C66